MYGRIADVPLGDTRDVPCDEMEFGLVEGAVGQVEVAILVEMIEGDAVRPIAAGGVDLPDELRFDSRILG